jgi:hypothetical protein
VAHCERLLRVPSLDILGILEAHPTTPPSPFAYFVRQPAFRYAPQYYQIFYNHRFVFVLASDVVVVP